MNPRPDAGGRAPRRGPSLLARWEGPFVARLEILLCAALFSTGGAAIKAIHLSGFQVACLRSGIAGLTLFVLLPAARRLPDPRTLAVSLTHAGTMILFVLSNKLTTSAASIYLQETSPLFVLLLSPWLLKEPIRRRDFGFMLALAAGLALFFVGLDPASATAPNPLRGDVMAILSGVFWAGVVVGLRFLSKRGGSGGTATIWGNVLVCLLCLPAALPFGPIRGADWALLLFLGVFQLGLAYFFLTRALTHVPAFEAALLLLLEPVLNPIWSWLFHGERPSPWSFAGGGVILGATVVKSWLDVRGRGAVETGA
jgi:drug/metabolite transporter, DME family